MGTFKRHHVPLPCFLQGRLSGGDLPIVVTLHHTATCLTGEQWEAMPSLCTRGKEGPARESRKAAMVNDKSKGHSISITSQQLKKLIISWKPRRSFSGPGLLKVFFPFGPS